MNTTEIVSVARRVLTAVPYGFLTTSGRAGPSVRMVQHLSIDQDLRVVFGTGRRTRKARELRADATAVYAAGDPATGAAACLYGSANIDDDLSHRRAAWVPELAPFFPAGPDGPEFVLVSLNPSRLEVWSAADRVHPEPFGLSSAVVLRSENGWRGPTATHPPNQDG